jgi:phosphatidylserine/phosphatidylglycerophosphate/cardiolipin synthase-like enzyme/predicted flap endonuclease-1-like 5' DNA nuclease
VQLPFLQRIRHTLALFLVLGLPACQQGHSQTQPSPLPQDLFVQVYTNHEPAASYTEPYRKITRSGDDLEQIIVDTIASAQVKVDVAVQELRLPKVAQALVDRHNAGIQVRVILENTYSRPFSSFSLEDITKLPQRERSRYYEARQLIDLNSDEQLSQDEINQRDALVMLDNAKIPRIDDTADGSEGSNLMHHKFVVVDDRTVIVTSANFTPSDVHGDFKTPSSRGNANNLVKIDSPQLAKAFTHEFSLMWGDGPRSKPDSKFGVKKPFRPTQRVDFGSTSVEVHFSPSSRAIAWDKTSNGLIGKTLSQASQSVEMALFVLSDQQLVNHLEPASQKGIQIRTLIDPQFAFRPYSEGLDMLGITLADNCRLEAGNRPWQSSITTVGVPRMPPGDLLHHKFGIVDHRTVITGSHNWTDAANIGNDETVMVIHSPTVAAHYDREFERLYTDAILGIPPAIRKKAEAQQKECGGFKPTQPIKSVVARKSPVSEELPKPAPGSKRDRPTQFTQKISRKTSSQKSPKLKKKKQQSSRSQPKKLPAQNIGQVNLNTATQAELEALPGIGPGLAQRIMAARQQQPFTSLADLDRVSGVGPKLLQKLEPHVTW